MSLEWNLKHKCDCIVHHHQRHHPHDDDDDDRGDMCCIEFLCTTDIKCDWLRARVGSAQLSFGLFEHDEEDDDDEEEDEDGDEDGDDDHGHQPHQKDGCEHESDPLWPL